MRSARWFGWTAAMVLLVLGARGLADNKPSSATLATLWGQLATADEGQATRAVLAMAMTPKETIELLDKQLKPIKVDKARVAQLIKQLGDDAFSRREEAARELATLGAFIRPQLEKAAESIDAEVKKRATLLLAQLPPEGKKPARPAGIVGRSVQVKNINGKITVVVDGKALDLDPPPVLPKPNVALLQTIRGIALLEHLNTPHGRKILQRLAEGEAEAVPTKQARAALERLEKR